MHARDQAVVVFLDISFLEVFSEIFLVFQPISSLSEGNKSFNKASEQPWKSNGMGTKCKENPKGKGKPRREENTQGLSSSLYPEFPSKSKFQEFWIFQSMLLV